MNASTRWTPPPSALSANFGQMLGDTVQRHGIADLSADDLPQFLQTSGLQAILLVDDPERSAENWDMAVIFPQLLKALPEAAMPALLRPVEARQVVPRYGVQRLPAVLFLRDGGYLGVIEGLRDWAGFVAEAGEILARAPGRAPSVGIAISSANSSCH
jgi:hydrogenase-1 operon protein HyaE